jgi:hypothetical protein
MDSKSTFSTNWNTRAWWRGVELNHLPEAYETSVQPLHFPTMKGVIILLFFEDVNPLRSARHLFSYRANRNLGGSIPPSAPVGIYIAHPTRANGSY